VIVEMLAELLEQLLAGAIDEALVATIQHEGEPARYVVFCPETGVTLGAMVRHGDWLRIYRNHRLIVEPIGAVRMRSLVELCTTWRTV
jgi:hypothetical protein